MQYKQPHISFEMAIVAIGCWIFCMVAASNLVGQPLNKKPDLDFYQIQEGLASNRITAIYQDHLGYIWVGTYNGLHKYNGLEFDVYVNSWKPNSINDKYIGSIFEDKDYNLWIGTGKGICRYNRETNGFSHFDLTSGDLGLSGETSLINTIVEDKNGKLWISGGDKGLYYFDQIKQQFVPIDDLNNYNISSITVGEENILWVGTVGDGLIKFDTSENQIVNTFTHDSSDPYSLASNDIYDVQTDHHGNLWIGTRGFGLDRMVVENKSGKFHHYRHQSGSSLGLGNDEIFTIYVDRSGKVWVGNINGGLHLYSRKEDFFFRYESDPQNPKSLSHSSINSIYQDRQGRYWIGTSLTGINIVDPYSSKFSLYNQNPNDSSSLNNNIIRDFWESDDENIWIATDGGGLNFFDRKQSAFQAFYHDPNNPTSIRSSAIIELDEDEYGHLWAGTWGGGANILLDQERGIFSTFKEKYNIDEYPIRHVFDIHFDREFDYIWLAVFEEGIYRYSEESGKIQLFSSSGKDTSGLSSNLVKRIYEDSNHNLWVGTLEGLHLIESENKKKGLFRRYSHANDDSLSIAGNAIRQIHEDKHKNIWVATDNGLSKYIDESGDFVNYYKSDGLPSNDIRSIGEDNSGNLWIGTVNGLAKFNTITKQITSYDKSDGLQGNEFSRYAVHQLESGEMLFGGMNGFNIFHPDSIKNNPYKPPVYFSDFKLFNKSVSLDAENSSLTKHISVTDTVTLSHDQSVFTFEFIALNYTSPQQNKYAFKMEGFEEKWNYVGNQRNATYTNLDAGTYIFRVKACNNDGVWNEKGASLTIIIEPPFWHTTWFYLLSAVVIGGIFIGAYRYRLRTIKSQNRYLEEQISSRTSELNSKNKDLKNALKELQNTRDELVEKAHKAGMADIATGVLHNVGNILNSINTSSILIDDTIKHSKVDGLEQANNLLRQHIDNIEQFVTENPKGRKLFQYYLKIEEPLKNERQQIAEQAKRLSQKIKLIEEVIMAQQNYAGSKLGFEQVILSEIVDEALALQAASIQRHDIIIKKKIQTVTKITVRRSKLVHVLVNLIKNAKEAVSDNDPTNRVLTIKVWENKKATLIAITDNGCGISPENISQVFSYGYTTKKGGHGFGLHSSANYLNEMEANINVKSQGDGQGTTFVIRFPKNKKLRNISC